jgi:hypothetical protein
VRAAVYPKSANHEELVGTVQDRGGPPQPAVTIVEHGEPTAVGEAIEVTAEAPRWGFWHFGHFSRAYKDCFGELASDTLRRDPSES